jgi:hypothetical protein
MDLKFIQKNIHFRNVYNGVKREEIWDELANGLYKKIVPENNILNALIEGVDTSKYKPVLKDFYCLKKGMGWDENLKIPYDPVFKPIKFDANLDTFLINAFNFFNQFRGKKIGVQLSGGLDSSLIIGLLKYFKIPFYLIGLKNNRFEFRTESYIQNILCQWADDAVLIDFESCLPYSNLESVPAHQYPDEYIRTFAPDFEIAKASRNLGIEILITGHGGDNVFGDAISMNPRDSIWMPHTYFEPWLQDLVYSPQGIKIVPFYGDENINNVIFNLRIGQKRDRSKIWARKYFQDFLPKELVDYSYHSDFWGFVISGVQDVLPKLPILFEQTYYLTQNNFFSKEKLKEIKKIDLLNQSKQNYMEIEPLIGIAVWIDSLVKHGIVKA